MQTIKQNLKCLKMNFPASMSSLTAAMKSAYIKLFQKEQVLFTAPKCCITTTPSTSKTFSSSREEARPASTTPACSPSMAFYQLAPCC